MSDTHSSAATAPFDLTPMLAAGESGARAFAEAQTSMLTRMVEMNREMLDFVGRRLERDRETSRRMAKCQSLSEAGDLYSDFVQGMMRDYTEEMGALAGLCAEQARTMMGEMQAQMTRMAEANGASSSRD